MNISKDQIQQINESIRTTPRNRQSSIGRKYCIKRLKTNNVSIGMPFWKAKNSTIKNTYVDTFGKCEGFFMVKAKKKDAITYMYYQYLKTKFTEINGSGVYIIGNIDKGICKIGYSTNPYKRLKSIQTGCPYEVTVLRFYEGIGKMEEKLLHKKYKKYKMNGEWFRIDGGIKKELLNPKHQPS